MIASVSAEALPFCQLRVYKTAGKIGKFSQLLRLRRGDKGEPETKTQMGCSQSTAKESHEAAVAEEQASGNK